MPRKLLEEYPIDTNLFKKVMTMCLLNIEGLTNDSSEPISFSMYEFEGSPISKFIDIWKQDKYQTDKMDIRLDIVKKVEMEFLDSYEITDLVPFEYEYYTEKVTDLNHKLIGIRIKFNCKCSKTGRMLHNYSRAK
jgi:hypothetical protein